MKFLSTQTQPNKTSIPGVYPILDEKEALTCTVESLIQDSTNNGSTTSTIESNWYNLTAPLNEETVNGYVYGIYEKINNQIGLNWEQSTTYDSFDNLSYWVEYKTTNVWTRTGNILTFTVYDSDGNILLQKLFNIKDVTDNNTYPFTPQNVPTYLTGGPKVYVSNKTEEFLLLYIDIFNSSGVNVRNYSGGVDIGSTVIVLNCSFGPLPPDTYTLVETSTYGLGTRVISYDGVNTFIIG